MKYLFSPLLLLCALICMGACGNRSLTADSTASAATAASDSSAAKPAVATLYFVGDAMQHQAQLDRARELGAGAYSYAGCFDLIAPTVKQADYSIVNLEVPLGGGRGGYTGFPCFSAPDSFAEALKEAGFDLFLTANNHTLDRKDYGLRRTLQVLDSLQVDHIGTYADARQREQLVPFIKEVNGIKIAFLNYTYGTNGITATDGAEVSLIDRQKMEHEIKLARERGAEIVCVCVHWGVEYQLLEHQSQRDLADFLTRQGVDIIMGGHPHVIQPMHMTHNPATGRQTLLVYSLGNFISNMKTGDTRGGASLTCTIERDAEGHARVTNAFYDTFYAAKPSGGHTNFRVIPAEMADSIPAAQLAWWNTFNNAAERIFQKHNTNISRKP